MLGKRPLNHQTSSQHRPKQNLFQRLNSSRAMRSIIRTIIFSLVVCMGCLPFASLDIALEPIPSLFPFVAQFGGLVFAFGLNRLCQFWLKPENGMQYPPCGGRFRFFLLIHGTFPRLIPIVVCREFKESNGIGLQRGVSWMVTRCPEEKGLTFTISTSMIDTTPPS